MQFIKLCMERVHLMVMFHVGLFHIFLLFVSDFIGTEACESVTSSTSSTIDKVSSLIDP